MIDKRIQECIDEVELPEKEYEMLCSSDLLKDFKTFLTLPEHRTGFLLLDADMNKIDKLIEVVKAREDRKIPSLMRSIDARDMTMIGVLHKHYKYAIPEGVKDISSKVFCDDYYLTKVSFPTTLKKIGPMAFRSTDISEAIFNEGLEDIGHDAFRSCIYLNKVKFPSSLKSIGDFAFESTDIECIDIECAAIGEAAFSSCRQLKVANLNKVECFGASAFSNCPELTYIHIPNIDVISAAAFYTCKNLEAVTFSQSLKRICPFAFSACEKLSQIELPDTLEEIQNHAFTGCDFVSFLVPKGCKGIGQYAFYGCGRLVHACVPRDCVFDKSAFPPYTDIELY